MNRAYATASAIALWFYTFLFGPPVPRPSLVAHAVTRTVARIPLEGNNRLYIAICLLLCIMLATLSGTLLIITGRSRNRSPHMPEMFPHGQPPDIGVVNQRRQGLPHEAGGGSEPMVAKSGFTTTVHNLALLACLTFLISVSQRDSSSPTHPGLSGSSLTHNPMSTRVRLAE